MNKKPSRYTELWIASLVVPEQGVAALGRGRDVVAHLPHPRLRVGTADAVELEYEPPRLTDNAAARKQASRDQRITPLSVATHVAAARAGALLGDTLAVVVNVQEVTARLPRARTPFPATASCRKVGVRSCSPSNKSKHLIA